MVWLGSGSRREKPQHAQQFEQADRAVVEAFADLHEARRLKSKFPGISPGALQQFERKAWNRLIDFIWSSCRRYPATIELARATTGRQAGPFREPALLSLGYQRPNTAVRE